MKFTADDLKRLKEQRIRVQDRFDIHLRPNEFDALLARLEAAEEYIFNIQVNGFDDSETSKAEQVWLKSKGDA